MAEQYLVYPQAPFNIPADTVVGPLAGTSPVYDFAQLPGALLRPRLFGRVSAAAGISKVQVNVRILTPSTAGDSVDRSDAIICTPAVGLASVAGPTYAKPAGVKRVNCTAQMDTAGLAGATEDMLLALDLVDAGCTKLWNFWQASNTNWSWSGGETLGGLVSYFDFSQIPLGATVTVVVAGMGRDIDANFNVRVSDVADYTNITGTVVMTGSFSGSFGGNGNPFSSVGTFVNTFSGVKLIKVTGYRTGGPVGSGAATSTTVVISY
jgi:hypothetical protein